MTAVKQIKAQARAKSGKGAARAVRREGRTPAVIYGGGAPATTISLNSKEIRSGIGAGRFLTTILEVEVEGKSERVIPRDFQLDPIKDFPIHIDFMRLTAGQILRVEVPVHFINHDAAPGLKRGGTLNIVRHGVELLVPAEAIPEFLTADLKGLDINDGIHISAIALPEGIPPGDPRPRLHHRHPSPRRRCSSRSRRPRPPKVQHRLLAPPLLLPLPVPTRCGSSRSSQERLIGFSLLVPGAPCSVIIPWRPWHADCDAGASPCKSSLASAIPAPAMRATGTISASWRSMRSPGSIGLRRGAAASKARPPRRPSAASASSLKPHTFMNESGRAVGEAARFYKTPLSEITVFHDELDLPEAKLRVKRGGGNAGHNGLRSITAHLGNDYRRVRLGIGHPGDKNLVHPYVLSDFFKEERPWVADLVRACAQFAALLARGEDASFANKVHLAMSAKGWGEEKDAAGGASN